MGRMNGKMVFVTGAARGQGRSHAYGLPKRARTSSLSTSATSSRSSGWPLPRTSRRPFARSKGGTADHFDKADVRDTSPLKPHCRMAWPNWAGSTSSWPRPVLSASRGSPQLDAWCDTINTNLVGVINTVQAALPHLGEGASIIATGSTAALMDTAKKDDPGKDPGGYAYVHSKRAIASYIHDLAGVLARAWHPRERRTSHQHRHRPDPQRRDVPVVPA